MKSIIVKDKNISIQSINDEDYISDNIKPIYIDNTIEKNKKEKEDVINSIKNIKNL